MPKKKLNLLVIPSLFPADSKDIAGIFVLDYLKSIEEKCNIFVFDFRLYGKKKGLRVENIRGMTVVRYYILSHEPKPIMKRVLYPIWISLGMKLGKRYFRGCDLIHAHGEHLHGPLGFLLSKLLGIPVVLTRHSPIYNDKGSLVKYFMSKVSMEKVNAVLAVSENLKQQIIEASIVPKRIYVTYNPVDTNLFTTKNREDLTEAKNIIFVGRLENYKGGLRSVMAFREIMDRHRDWRITIIGDGKELSEIKMFIEKDAGLLGRVILKGRLTKEQIAAEMRQASFLVFPSIHETFGIVAAEAMASGLPVIAAYQTGPEEFVDEESGLLIDAGKVSEIEKGMQHMISNLDRFYPEAIRRKVVDKFGLEAFGDRLYSIYQDVL